MKKLIIAAAIVCAAAISHGAALQWGFTTITKGESSVAAGAIGYFMAASTWADFSAKAANEKAAFCVANSTYSGTVASSARQGMYLSQISGTYQAGDSISGYIVLFDTSDATKAGYYANSTVSTVSVPSAGDAKIQPAFSTTSGWTKTSDPEPTPEPTSGLLMLLGVAGLALKRKQK